MPQHTPLLTPLVLALGLGCAQDPVEALEAYAEEVCVCEDADCVEKVRRRWEEKNVDQVAAADLSDAETERGMAAIEKALTCQSELAP